MATLSSHSLSQPKMLAKLSDSSRSIQFPSLNHPWAQLARFGSARVSTQPVRAVPEGLSEKVAESIKSAEEACAGDPVSRECVAAWDEVEELSAAASHARDKNKDSDPLETYCKDHPERGECRTYDD